MTQADLVEIKENDFISIRLMYASRHNIPRVDAYGHFGLGHRCFAHKDLLDRLLCLEKPLKKRQLKIKIFDAYRPPEAHEYMSARVPVEGLFAQTPELSQHCHGTAIDVCLTDENGRELPFPTKVDAYTFEFAEQLAQGITEPYFNHLQKANYACVDLPQEAMNNRALLCSLMEEAGFERLQSEWWHFNLPSREKYPLVNFRRNQNDFSFFFNLL